MLSVLVPLVSCIREDVLSLLSIVSTVNFDRWMIVKNSFICCVSDCLNLDLISIQSCLLIYSQSTVGVLMDCCLVPVLSYDAYVHPSQHLRTNFGQTVR
jgi:hypothetical protein